MGLFDKLGMGGNTLFYLGCLTKFVGKDIGEKYKKIFLKIGIDFIQLKDLEVCCGSPILNSGHKKEAVELMEKNFDVFRKHGVKRIITACPACYHMFEQTYPKYVKEWNIKVEHASQTIAKAIKEKKLNPKKLNMNITFHDPCHLGRYSNVYEEPRDVIKSVGEIKEMKLKKEYAYCCGGGSGVKSNYPQLANAIAKERIDMALETKADCLVTCCPMCYFNLKENTKKIKVKELSEIINIGDEDES